MLAVLQRWTSDVPAQKCDRKLIQSILSTSSPPPPWSGFPGFSPGCALRILSRFTPPLRKWQVLIIQSGGPETLKPLALLWDKSSTKRQRTRGGTGGAREWNKKGIKKFIGCADKAGEIEFVVGKMTVIGLSDLFRHCNQIYRCIMYIYSESFFFT